MSCLLAEIDLTLLRYSERATIDARGFAVHPEPVEVPISASVQDLPANLVEKLPEVMRSMDSIELISYDEIRGMNRVDELLSDRVVFEGVVYAVHKSVKLPDAFGGAPHWEAIAVAVPVNVVPS